MQQVGKRSLAWGGGLEKEVDRLERRAGQGGEMEQLEEDGVVDGAGWASERTG